MIRRDRDDAGRPETQGDESSRLDDRGGRMRALFDEVLGVDADARTEVLRAAVSRDGVDEEMVDEVRSLLAFVDATRIDDDAAVDDDRPERLLGCRLGGFMLERLVGIGGTAAVFEATQDRPRRTVAVKVLRQAIGGRRARRRFEREIEIAGRLDHPAIARVYDSGLLAVDGIDTPWLAMEFVPGARTITGHAADRHLDSRDRVELLRDAIGGIAAAHRRGVIHRDIKPANLLVDGRGRARVIDFGIARQTSGPRGDLTATSPGQVVGTVPFMAPEQLGGDSDAVDVRTDVYATGMVLHLLLTGRMPYETAGCDFLEAARRIREVEVGSLRRLDASIDRDLDGIVQKALAKDPARRYQTIDALDADLEAWLDDRPVEARPLGAMGRSMRLARRHPLPTALASVAVFSLVAATVVLAIMLGRESALRARGDRATARAAIAAAAAALQRGDMGSMARYLTSVPASERGWEFGWLEGLVDHSDVVFEGERADMISVDVLDATEDRPSMLLATGYRGTAAYDLDTLSKRWSFPEFSQGGCWKHAVLPGERRLAIVGLAEDIAIVDLHDGSLVRRWDTEGAVGAMWPVTDGTMILGGDDGWLSRMNLETGELEAREALDHRGISTMAGLADGRILVGTMSGALLETDADLSEIRVVRRFEQMIPRVRANADDSLIAVCTNEDRVELLDADTYETTATFDDHDADVWDARFDEQGGRLVTACNDESIRVFNLATGEMIQQLSGPYGFVWSLALENDGRHAWYGCQDGSVRRGSLLEATPILPEGETAEAIAWSPDAERIAVRTDRGVHLLEVATRRWIDFIDLPSNQATIAVGSGVMTWADDGIWCGAGVDGGLAWLAPDLSRSRRLLPDVGVTAVHAHPDGGVVVTFVKDDEPRVVRLDSSGAVRTEMPLEHRVLAIEPDPRTGHWHVLHYSRGRIGEILDRDSLARIDDLSDWKIGDSFDIAFTPDGNWIAVGGRETPDNVAAVERDGPRLVRHVRRIGHIGDARHVDFLDGGRRLVTGGDDGRIIVGPPDDAEPILTMFDSKEAIQGLDVSPDGRSLAATNGRIVFLALVPSD